MALMVKAYALRCPTCGRFLGEVEGIARLVCRDCGHELVFIPKGRRIMPGGLDKGWQADIIEATE